MAPALATGVLGVRRGARGLAALGRRIYRGALLGPAFIVVVVQVAVIQALVGLEPQGLLILAAAVAAAQGLALLVRPGLASLEALVVVLVGVQVALALIRVPALAGAPGGFPEQVRVVEAARIFSQTDRQHPGAVAAVAAAAAGAMLGMPEVVPGIPEVPEQMRPITV